MTDKPYEFNSAQLAWLHDLETTEEPQTKGRLHRLISRDGAQPGYCCLGRGCVVLGVTEVRDHDVGVFDLCHIDAPESVIKALRLRSNLGTAADECLTLAELNDDGWSFKEIAEEIRDNPWKWLLPPEESAS